MGTRLVSYLVLNFYLIARNSYQSQGGVNIVKVFG